ncbi:hypothetical protein [Clostridium hydrogenum]|uniref:hypothetical protein n=1 Tax=Clostridium hydrogenum TaxID=2855764 RepID=UPI001F21BF62|nr:hypothetical protein [Clostridium hydrogenum]
MKSRHIVQTIALTLAITMGASLILTSVYDAKAASKSTSATYSSASNKDKIKIINKDAFEINGVKYSISSIAKSINGSTLNKEIHPNSAATVVVKKAFKWIVEHWTTIVSKVPGPLRKYLELDGFMKVANQFLSISNSIQDFLTRTFRAMGMPEDVNWILTNIIIILLPF